MGWCICATPLAAPGLPPNQLPSPLFQSQQCRSGQLPREQVWAKLPLSPPCPSRGSSLRCLCLQGELGGNLGKKPYAPWTPTQTQLWEARSLLTGEGEWAAPKCVFVPEGDPLHRGTKSSMRWVCGYGSCQKLVSSQLDGRGHYQSTHLGRTGHLPTLLLWDYF